MQLSGSHKAFMLLFLSFFVDSPPPIVHLTDVECEAIKRLFKKQLKLGKLPSLEEIEENIRKNPFLDQRPANAILTFLRKELRRRKQTEKTCKLLLLLNYSMLSCLYKERNFGNVLLFRLLLGIYLVFCNQFSCWALAKVWFEVSKGKCILPNGAPGTRNQTYGWSELGAWTGQLAALKSIHIKNNWYFIFI